jgi:hypothetical protein
MNGDTSVLSLPAGRQVHAAPAVFLGSLLTAQKSTARPARAKTKNKK